MKILRWDSRVKCRTMANSWLFTHESNTSKDFLLWLVTKLLRYWISVPLNLAPEADQML